MSASSRPRLLILSFDAIDIDPRVIKQVRRFAEDHEVTTCSPGGSPDPRVEHVTLDPADVRPLGRLRNLVDDIAREREWFGWTYDHLPLVQQTRRRLRGRAFDAVLANDGETLGAAISLVGADRVHADLHEFYPGLPVDETKLGLRQRRYWTWLITRFASRVRSSTTVGREIAKRYREYGLDAGVVTNATPFRDFAPTSTQTPIRLVHSGNPFRERGLAEIMRAVAASTADVSLDLYLTYNPPTDREQLVALADELGPRITVREPVSQAELIDVLHDYDLGIHVLPPTSENNALALPNKFFDFVQARLGIIVGPSIEMASIVTRDGLGIVTEDFSESSILAALNGLTPAAVDEFKAVVQANARALSAEVQVENWVTAVRAIAHSA
ncbi:glycosyltransferase family 1 protein [Microbacterium luteolum]|uniref:Glycosyltransferase family 1 protein n=1 Tax=Microbacterium luteolum TaxID=69367 RepID=A0ABY7XNP4_MICLT|nr:glycosyltransferase family 1 protein [Microbacterium luteolum]WDM43736.1 glycosyltransferase family 1 protein [Microbacterium luteolum]